MLRPGGTVVCVVVTVAAGTSLSGQPLAGGVDVSFNASAGTSEIFLTNTLHETLDDAAPPFHPALGAVDEAVARAAADGQS